MNAQDLNDLIGSAAAFGAAQDVGLLAALQTTPASASAHAEKLGLDARATERVLEVLLALGLAAKTGDQYAASPALVDWVESSPGGALLSVGLWNHTSEFLRTGAPFVRMDASAELREEGYRNVVSRLGKMFEPIAREVAAQVKGKPRRILDLGCGSGVWSLAIAESHPEAHVTGLDLPRVLDAFRARASALGLTNRIATIEGDVHLVDIPAQAFDLVIIANVLRIETPERARSIVARAANALSPDGTLLVVDALAEGVPERQRALAVYALHLSMRTVQGRVHSVPDIERWLAECGLVDSTQLRLVSPGPVGALVARRATSTAV